MTRLLELSIAGLATGAQFALVALGFVIIFKATGVINFAQGGLLALGAYLTFAMISAGLPFLLAVIVGALLTALVGASTERLVLRRMVGQPVFAVIMITIGLLFILNQVVTTVWGPDARNLGDPWNVRTVDLGEVTVALADIWTFVIAGLVLLAFFAFFRFTNWGVAMRATAFDQEAALAQGISARKVFALSWAIAGGLAALGGMLLATGPAALSPGIQNVALLAFPAMIVGGLDSPGGAVIGGLLIGLITSLVAGYQSDYFPWLGEGFSNVAPYVVMVLILLVRPYGLFGTPEVRRV